MGSKLMRNFIVVFLVTVFLSVFILPVNSFQLDDMTSKTVVDSSIERKEEPSTHWSDRDEYHPERGCGKFDYLDKYEQDPFEQYPYHSRQHSDLLDRYQSQEYDLTPPFYENLREERLERYEEYSKNQSVVKREPTPKPNFAEGKTWYVDDDAKWPFLGTKKHPFRFIQDALNVTDDGDTVFVLSLIHI